MPLGGGREKGLYITQTIKDLLREKANLLGPLGVFEMSALIVIGSPYRVFRALLFKILLIEDIPSPALSHPFLDFWAPHIPVFFFTGLKCDVLVTTWYRNNSALNYSAIGRRPPENVLKLDYELYPSISLNRI